MIPESCRLFEQDHATKQVIRAKWRFDLISFRSRRNALRSVLVVALVLVVGGDGSKAADRCSSYGDEKTDFTWRLCPAGEKYERRYLYFGAWSSFYRVPDNTGACQWWATKSTW